MKAREIKDLIAALAVFEHGAWETRNATRKAYREWLKNYLSETGEWYDREACQHGGEVEDIAAHDALKDAAKAAQRKLTSARAATRRAVVRAIAASQAAEERKSC